MKYNEKEYEVKILQEAKYVMRERKRKKGERRKGELTVAYINLEDGSQLIGVAERSKNDSYDADQAKLVAVGRLEKKIKKRMKVPIV